MKDEITIPLVKEENLIAAVNRREKYSLKRDVQAEEFNRAISKRISKDSEKKEQEHELDLEVDTESESSL
jgi:hypothetical protein